MNRISVGVRFHDMLFAALALLAVLVLFGPVLVSDRLFVFRDASHYYYPLFSWIASQWGDGQVPLWNPLEDLGVSLAADPTASLWYPGKLVFALPVPFALRDKVYIVGHVLLAAVAMFVVARRWRASPAGAALAAVAYALGGSVLFQYCNVIFLVGAAWLPLALVTMDRLVRRPSVFGACGFGSVLALMVLGGDVEAAYHSVLMALGYCWLIRRSKPVVAMPNGFWGRPAKNRIWGGRYYTLALSLVIALLLSAIQVLPSFSWARRSTRAMFTHPRSIYEFASYKLTSTNVALTAGALDNHRGRAKNESWNGLLARTVPGTHHDAVFQFSVGPWRWPELIWPNVGGRQFPTNRRWMTAIPAEGRVWTPSLYVGLLPIVLAMASLRLRKGTCRRRWLSWLVVLSGVAALGGYGVGWLANELLYMFGSGNNAPVGSSFGGVYWMMTVLLPGYVNFRYPAKLWVLVQLGVSLLAGRGFDSLFQRPGRALVRPLAILMAISLMGVGIISTLRSPWASRVSQAPADPLFGPLDVAGARADTTWAFAHTTAMCVVLWALHFASRKYRSQLWMALAVGLTGIELVAAHRWMIPTAPARLWEQPIPLAAEIKRIASRQDGGPPVRIARSAHSNWWPNGWDAEGSPSRQINALRWERDTLFPKHNLLENVAVLNSAVAIPSGDYEAFLRSLHQYAGGGPYDVAWTMPHKTLVTLHGQFVLAARKSERIAESATIKRQAAATTMPANCVLWHLSPGLPRAWIVHQAVCVAPVEARQLPTLTRRTSEMLFEHGRLKNLHKMAIVETLDDRVGTYPPSGASTSARSADRCSVISHHPNRVEVAVKSDDPGLLILNELFDPGWTATIESIGQNPKSAVPVLRTNRVMRGVWLDAGTHKVVFRYRPWEFVSGAVISGFAWSAAVLYLVIQLWLHSVRRLGSHA